MREEKLLAGRALTTLLALGALGLGGCSGTDEAAEAQGADDGERVARQITELSAELEPVVAGNNRFAWSVYQASLSPRQNLFYSPFSLTLALGMTYAGARGTTAQELHDALSVQDDAAFHSGLGALNRDLVGEHAGRGYELYAANRLFGAAGTAWSPDTLALLENTYDAPLEELPFGSDPEAARQTVNTWVEQQTHEQLSELIQRGDFDQNTLFALVNATYFAATWQESFDAKLTADAPFQLEDGSSVMVPMLERRATQLVAQDEQLTLLELDYADRELSMVLLIPEVQGGLTEVEPSLNLEHIEQLLASGSPREAIVRLPRLELRAELPLAEVLQALGVHEAFDPLLADFSGMVADPLGLGEIFLTSTRHQGYVQVDEQGTKAAAATAVVGGTRSVPLEYSADHAFAFLIRDKLTGTYLFAGRVVDPR